MPRISVRGDVVDDDTAWLYDWFGIECVSPKKIRDVLADNHSEEITLEINSSGGDVIAASEIYTMLRGHNGNTVAEVFGLAASAASVIAVGCSNVRISPTAHIMIHNASIVASGNKEEYQQLTQLLAGIDESIINAYEAKTGLAREEIANLMKQDKWFNAQEAVENGFANEVMFDEKITITNSTSNIIPKASVNKLKELIIKSEKQIEEPKDILSLTQKKLNLLKGE